MVAGIDQVQRFELCLPYIGGNDLSILGPADPGWFAEAPSENFLQGIAIVAIRKRIARRNAIISVSAVVTSWINSDNLAPDALYAVGDKRKSRAHTSPIPYAKVNQPIILITGCCQRIESKFLDTV